MDQQSDIVAHCFEQEAAMKIAYQQASAVRDFDRARKARAIANVFRIIRELAAARMES
jgi:hypothetical protein